MTADLVAFLRACLDEDEQTARTAAEPESWVELNRQPRPSWAVQFWADPDVAAVVADESSAYPVAVTPLGMSGGDAEARASHIARHDPVRVLAEVNAKQRILDRYEDSVEDDAEDPYDTQRSTAMVTLQDVVRLLALPYAGHPDYQPEWAPNI